MPLTIVRLAAVLLALLLLAGCGSSSYQDTARSATGKMRDIIQTFNSANPRDVTSTGQACKKAYDNLQSQASSLDAGSPPAKYRAEATQLRAAYRQARAGFRLCYTAAANMNYAGMVAAEQQIAAANAAISRARALEH